MDKKTIRENAKGVVIDILVDIVAGLLIAVGIYNFASTASFPMSGVSGIALIFYQLFHLPIGVMTMVLNIPIAILAFKFLGLKFFVKSLKSMVISSIMTDVVAPLFPVYHGDLILAALCCGVLSGIGYALIFMRDSSTGGTDFIIMSLRVGHPHWSIGKISFMIDLVIIFLGTVLVSKNIESLIYGILISYLLSVVMDKIMYGISQGKVAMIVTDHGKEVCEAINDSFGRGATILDGKGSFTGQKKEVVMCASTTKQAYGVRRVALKVDPSCFIMIMESSDVVGEGFKAE